MTEARSRPPTHLRARARAFVLALVCLLSSSTAVLAQESAQGEGQEASSLASLVRETPELSTLSELLEYGSLMTDLERPLRLTLLAPSDAAFERLPEEVQETLRRNPGALNYVLRNHMIVGAAPTSALRRMDAVTSLLPTRLPIYAQDEALRIDGARIIQADLRATNGVLHVIDSVLVPSAATSLKNVLTRPEGQ